MVSDWNRTAATGHWDGTFDESGLQAWAERVRAELLAPRVSLGLVFMTPDLFDRAGTVLEILQVHGRIPLLLGCSTCTPIAQDQQWENRPGIVLGLFHLPGAELRATRFTQAELEGADGPAFWHAHTGVQPGRSKGWLAFVDPFHLDAERWLQGWNGAFPTAPVAGGMAGGDYPGQRTQVYLGGEVYEEGAVALSVGGQVRMANVLSQGCTPIGDTWTITKVERNVIQRIANRPAYRVLAETFAALPPVERKRTQNNIFVGLATDEYKAEFHRGDFLIRSLLDGDPASGALAIGALPRAGQTIQFQRRDAASAGEDLTSLLREARSALQGARVLGGCLCTCNGRGQQFFGVPHHDAALAQRVLGPLGLVGFFCSGEIGPVGGRSFVHGYTASLALFVGDRS